LTFALARMGGLVRATTDLRGDGGLEGFAREGGLEDDSLYPNLTVTCSYVWQSLRTTTNKRTFRLRVGSI
jgi:hypothetical protein